MSEANGPLVSVIIPVHNRTELLREAALSALAQSYRPIEIIIVDDGSTDPETPRESDRLSAENPDVVRAVRIPNSGPGAARQAGLDRANGTFVQFLDSDDLLLPRKLELQVDGLMANPECALSYGKTREHRIGAAPVDVPARRTGERFETLFPAALEGRIWATETPLYRRSALEAIGPWSRLRVLEDWEYECRLGARGARLHYCDAFVSDHRHHRGPRLGLRWQTDDSAFLDMLAAHTKVFGYAQAAHIDNNSPEMRHFARNLFRLARAAGARGFDERARELLGLARTIDRRRTAEYRVFGGLIAVLGWRRTVRWGERLAGVRRRILTRAP